MRPGSTRPNLERPSSPPPARGLARLLLLGTALAVFAGCHSAFVQTTVTNRTGGVVHLLEFDYPSASFGFEEIAPGASVHYRFKILDTGPSKLTWTDAAHQEHTAAGPALEPGEEGRLAIDLNPAGAATFRPELHHL